MNNQKIRKIFLMSCFLAIGFIFLFISLWPVFPEIKWYAGKWLHVKPDNFVNLDALNNSNAFDPTLTPENIDPRIKIPEIGVDMEIVYDETDEQQAFARGAWLLPGTAEPGGLSGNSVIAAHRYMFTSGTNTFYHLDKLKKGDKVYIHWRGMDFVYVVQETKIVEPSEVGVLEPTETPTLTLFTCHPVYTTQSRLVVVAELSTN